ncbi:hypothetical protein KDM41_01065 [bacterium]|nr:hypothetical protein [bacterium]
MTSAGLLVVAAALATAAPEADGTRAGELHVAGYTAAAWGHAVAGALVWLDDGNGSLRVEVARGGPAAPTPAAVADLCAWRGSGWTLVCGENGEGTLAPWSEPWRPVAAGLSQAVRAIAAAVHAGPGDDVGRTGRPWRAAPPARREQRLEVANLVGDAPRAGWHGLVGGTGWGRGRAGEILALAWLVGPDGSRSRLQVRASGRPGALELVPDASRAVRYYDPDAFIPLWPLAESLLVPARGSSQP